MVALLGWFGGLWLRFLFGQLLLGLGEYNILLGFAQLGF
jgi:hypothetical protein